MSSKISKAERAKIITSPSLIKKLLKNDLNTYQITDESSVYLASVIDNIIYEIIQEAKVDMDKNKKKTITKDNIYNAYKDNAFLENVLGKDIIIT